MGEHVNRGYVICFAYVVCIGSVMFGMEMSKANLFQTKFFRDSKNAEESSFNWKEFWLPVGFFFGAVLGCAISGFTLSFGRRTMMIYADLLHIMATFPQITAVLLRTPRRFRDYEYSLLFCGRLMTGCAVGISSVVIPLFLKEISPPEQSGRIQSIHPLGVVMGEVLGYALSYVLTKGSPYEQKIIRYSMMTPAMLGAIQLLLLLFSKPYDTPKYYLSNDSEPECMMSLARIYAPDRRQNEFHALIANRDHAKYKNPTYLTMFSSGYRSALLVAVVFMLCRNFSGSIVILIFSVRIFDAQSSAWMALAGLVSCFIFSFGLDRWGRRPFLIAGSGLMFLSTVSWLVIILVFQEKTLDDAFYSPLYYAIVVYEIVYWGSVGTLGMFFFTEFLPDPGCAIAQGMYWMTATGSVTVFALLTGDMSSFSDPETQSQLLLLFGGFCVASALLTCWCVYRVKETQGRSDYESMKMYSAESEDTKSDNESDVL